MEIFKADAPKRVNNPEACGLRHLAFKVECIEKTVAELENWALNVNQLDGTILRRKK